MRGVWGSGAWTSWRGLTIDHVDMDAFGARDRVEGADHVPGYTALECVGRGRVSAVYRATDEQRQRVVALKVLLLDGLDHVELRRFRRECQVTSRLSDHPNVASALEVGTTDSGRPYVVMDFFERGSLGDRLTREGPSPVEEVLRAGVEVASALGAAHAAGILHRDVRPQNILVSERGEHALADFGIAALTEDRSQWLSLDHAAPEILRGQPPSSASDVYSLGATLYELLAGQPAYRGATEDGIAPLLLRIATHGPPAIPRPDVPAALMAVIRQAMASDPDDRILDAFALADRLRQLGPDVGRAGAAPVPAAPPSRTWEDRRPASEGQPQPARRALATALAVAVLGIAAGLGIQHAFLGGRTPSGSPSPVSATPPARSPTAAPTPDEIAIDAARPTGLTAVDEGTAVVLRWHLAAGNRYPLFVQESSPDRGASAPTPVPNGSTTTTVRGLDAGSGYCFQVGAVVSLGRPSTVAWSAPTCMRGAIARPTPTV